MPAGPGSIARAALAGIVLSSMAALPLLAQTTPAVPEAAVPETVAPDAAAPSQAAEGVVETEAAPQDAGEATVTSSATDLAEVEASLQLSRERIDALKAEIAAMEGDQTQQNAALIAAGQRVKMAEIEVADVEERLSELIVAELEVRGRLDGADAEIANVLAALQRISLNPPPALVVDPSDALGSARGAMLIAAIVPQLRAKADSVALDLKELTDIKERALAEEETLKANYAVLEEEQLRIATLIAARKQGLTQRNAALDAQVRDAVELAERSAL